MISLLQGNAWDWYMGLGENEKRDVRSLTDAFKEHFYEDSHDDYLSKLFTRKQGDQERISDYIVTMRKLATKADVSGVLINAIIKGCSQQLKPMLTANKPTNI